MDNMHLPVFFSESRLSQPRRCFRDRFRRLVLSVATPLMLGGAIALPSILAATPAQAQWNTATTNLIQRSLRLGDRGPGVLQLQQMLVQRGLLNIQIPNSAREGYFGPATKAALQAFQRNERDLISDGVLGEATFRRLFAVGLTPTQAYSIALMQAQLGELGYYRSNLDGQFGPATEEALRGLRDEAFVALDPRVGGLENSFDVVDEYYDQQRDRQDLPHSDALEARIEQQLPESRLWGYSSTWNSPVAIRSQDFNVTAPSRYSSRTSTYRVIVPLDRDATQLSALQSLTGSATLRGGDGRGNYAQVGGAYSGRRTAEDMVAYLRSEGFDARVIYN